MDFSRVSHQAKVVLVRGGGIAGRSLALLLARNGVDVTLVEHAMPMQEQHDPRAYALNAVSVSLLEDLRAWPQELACPVYDMQIEGDAGGHLAFSAWRQEVAALTHIVPAVAVEQALAQAIHFQSRITCVTDDKTAELPPMDLIAICEGRDSVTRQQFGFEMQTKFYRHRALAAHLKVELPHGHIARQWFDGQGGVLALLPLAANGNNNEVSLVWSLPETRAMELQGMPKTAFLEQLFDAVHGVLGTFELKSSILGWDLRFAYAKHWIANRGGQTAVLVADAAHAMHPLAGQGLNVGLGDVIELARVLCAAPDWCDLASNRVLRPYERARKAAFMKIGGFCNALFEVNAQSSSSVRFLRNQGMKLVDHCKPLKNWLAAQARLS